jgi:2-dehydro-3-deoxyphosphogluconate aldolase / (4S)-4-hydroxy-2-oxoglutarate aldolase
MKEIFTQFQSIGIVPVVKINSSKNAVDLAKSLCKGGLPAAEITFRSDAAEESIRQIAKNVPEVCVCAGTVLTVENAKRAVDAGAKLIISPGTNTKVVKWCVDNGIAIIPGCATPSEVELCMEFGLKVVKLFPAEVVGGVKMLKALSGPYAKMMFMPTGGINAQNVAEYLALENVLACGGSWMVPEKAIDNREFEKIEELTRKATNLLKR